MSFKFRPHRGSLKDSMKEMVELKDLQALREHVGDNSATIEPYHNMPDPRINWNRTCIVKDSGGFILGFTDNIP